MFHSPLLRVLPLGLLLAASVVQAAPKKTVPRPADPFADPKDDPYNPLRYIASNVLTAIAFALILLVGLIQTWMVRKWGGKYMLSMVIGAYTFAFGIGTRFGLHSHPESKGIYIIEYLFVVLSPCAFIASEYVLLGRLARYLRADKYLIVNPRRITITFISSDITTFLIQAAGGSVSIASNTLSVAKLGSNIFLAGLVLQLASFLTFTCIFFVFIRRVYIHEPETWTMHASRKWHQDWRTLTGAMIFSFFGILIRSVYRVAELSQGFEGYLATTERFFYGLDTLPLFIAISIYVFFWPGRIIGNGTPPTATSPVKESVDSIPAPEKAD
ncbi:RTA1-domain-containing protein [Mycena sanguinolenta]|uniref:RTA1-domain-containing protein n=1 Tax=Mycena sanguinolenta TaxID=230812 RepID=A0A8H6Y925_9AGAR|nr:RTA1-domain-containing protein [Mycena sanguinolenta]